MRTREELDRELHWYDGGTAQAEQMQKHLRELALDQRDLLVEIRDLLRGPTGFNPLPRLPSSWAYEGGVTTSPETTTLRDSLG